jgi:hypothetical protein
MFKNRLFSKIQIVCTLFLFIFVFVSLQVTPVHASENMSPIIVKAEYAIDYDSVEDMSTLFDYSFVGIVKKYLDTSQYNGYGSNIPYTFFEVKVTEEIVGDVENSVVITFYGGANEKGTMVLMENGEMPAIDQEYLFYANKVVDEQGGGRNLQNTFIISNPHLMVSLDKSEEESTELIEPNRVTNFSASKPDTEEIIVTSVDPGGGGGGYTNISFSTAKLLTLNNTETIYFYTGITALYYKFSISDLNYLSIYSTGSLDSYVSLYNENQNFVTSNNTASGHGLDYTSSPNFFLNYYDDTDEGMFYFKVQPAVSGTTGFTYVHFMIDNWYSGSYANLVMSADAVDDGHHVDYKDQTQYDDELELAIIEWNKMETNIIRKDTIFTQNDVTLSDYTDIYTTTVAVTTFYSNDTATMEFNNAYFTTMTSDERQKTIMHEFGHCMGLYEFTATEITQNVMVQGIRPLTHLGPADIGVYIQKWN